MGDDSGTRRTAGGQYAPGQSGNKRGRPRRMAGIKEAAAAHTAAAVAYLATVLNDPEATRQQRHQSALALLRLAGANSDTKAAEKNGKFTDFLAQSNAWNDHYRKPSDGGSEGI